MSLAEKDRHTETKKQAVTNHNRLTFLRTSANWSIILVLFTVTHMFAHSSFKCESQRKCKCKIKCTSQVSKSVSFGIIIAMFIALMLIVVSAVIVIKPGPDSPGYEVEAKGLQQSAAPERGLYRPPCGPPAASPASTEH